MMQNNDPDVIAALDAHARGGRSLGRVSESPAPPQPLRTGTPAGRTPSQDAPELEMPVQTYVDARPAALINGVQVTWGELRPALSEAAGAQILQEHIIDQALARQLTARRIMLSSEDLARERELLLEAIDLDPERARLLLGELRVREGLGDLRFDALLHRNAQLRALVRDSVKVTEAQIRRMFDIVHGPQRQARVIVVSDLRTAQDALDRIEVGESFADVAVALSTDESAARGGLIEPISLGDPSYPDVLRTTLWGTPIGGIAGPVLVEQQYVILLVERETPGDDVTLEEEREGMERFSRLSQERTMMDELVRKILTDVSLTIFDEDLRESWRMQTLAEQREP